MAEARVEAVREVPEEAPEEVPAAREDMEASAVRGPLWEADPAWAAASATAAGDTDPHHPLDGAADAAAACCR